MRKSVIATIDTLLDLNRSILDQGNGYWIKRDAGITG